MAAVAASAAAEAAAHRLNKQQSVPLGSRWYIFGKHYEVTGHTTKDGEPAVTMRNAHTRKRLRVPVLSRYIERRGRPSGE